MHLTWYGQSCFRIQIKTSNKSNVSIITDPQTVIWAGGRKPSFSTQIILNSQRGKNDKNKSTSADKIFSISGPGEYEIEEIFIRGINYFPTTVYFLQVENISLLYLGTLSKLPDNEVLKQLNSFLSNNQDKQQAKSKPIDVLLIPIGGKDIVLSAEQAKKVINIFEPRLIIPMSYYTAPDKIKLDLASRFINLMNAKKVTPIDKLVVNQKMLADKNKQIIVLKRK